MINIVNWALVKENILTYSLLFVLIILAVGSFYYYNIIEQEQRNSYVDYGCCYALCKEQEMLCEKINLADNTITCMPDDTLLSKQRGIGYLTKLNIFEVSDGATCQKLNIKYNTYSNQSNTTI